MEAVEPNWAALLVFLVCWAVGVAGVVFVSGALPVSAAPRAVQAGLGPVLVWVNVALMACLVVATLWYGVSELRWTSLLVGGGFVALFAPLVVQDLPVALKDTKTGLGVLTASAVAALVLIGWAAS